MNSIRSSVRWLFIALILLVMFSGINPAKANTVPDPIQIDNSDGLMLHDKLYSNNLFPYDFRYNFDAKFYLTDGTYLGKMIHIAEDAWLERYGRTFAHPSTYYKWGQAFGGNPAYVRDNVWENILERTSDEKLFTRAHSLELGYASGAIVTPIYNDAGLSHVVVEKSPYPSGSYTNDPVAIVGEEFTLSLTAQEFNPHTEYLRYGVWANNFYNVQEGSVNQNSVSNLEIPLTFTSGGHRPITIRLYDSINRQTNIHGSIYLNHRPVADFDMDPNPTDRLRTVSITSKASDKDGEVLVHKYEYREKGLKYWKSISTSENPNFTFPNVGTYEVRQTVTDPYDASDSVIKDIVVENIGPIADFTSSPATIYNDTRVSFTNNSTDPDGDTLTHQWAYQEPGSSTWVNFSTRVHPSRIFDKKGSWNIRLTVSDGAASDSTTKRLNVVNRPPVADFTHSPSSVSRNTTVRFENESTDADGDPLTYQWAYQEPNSSTWVNFSSAENPSRVFNKKGTWNIRLIANDGTASDTLIKPLVVGNLPPVAAFAHSPTTIYNDTTVSFNNTSSDPDGDPLTYQWAYQEPGSSTWVNFNTSKNPNRVFNKKGTWNIRLTANDGSLSDSVVRELKVSNRSPVADFNWNPTTIYNNTTVNLSNASSDPDGDTLNYQWAYREPGSTTWVNFSSTKDPARIFNEKGSWTLRLTASDGSLSDTVTKTIVVSNRSPVAAFNWSPTTIYNDTNVSFNNQSSDPDGDALTYQWAYQEPGTTTWRNFSTTDEPSRIFTKKGNWNVRLTVNDGAASHAVTKTLQVGNRPPAAAFTFSPSIIYNDTTVNFSNSSSDPDGDSLTYQWAYQEPGSSNWVNFSSSSNPHRIFNKKGTWKVRLTANDGSLNHTAIQNVVVSNRSPIADFNWNPTTIYNNTTVNLVNRSTDADGDSLTYQWAYQEPGSTTWVNFSTGKDPARVFDQKGTWNVRLTVNDGTAAHAVVKQLTVSNRKPVASITYNPAIVYIDTEVTLSGNASDPDGDSLTYQWEVQRPNTSTWTRISTNVVPTYTFNQKGTWNVRLTVSDGEDSGVATQSINVVNRPPVADFTFNPSTIYNNTNVKFTNSSTDPDNDTLTYQWAYQEPNSSTWTNFSTAAEPSRVFDQKGTWNIRLTVNDGAASHSIVKPLSVLNRVPVADFTWSPFEPYLGEELLLNPDNSYDPDGNIVSYEWEFIAADGSSFSSSEQYPAFVAKSAHYDVTLTVTDDSGDTGSFEDRIDVNIAKIEPFVTHTAQWKSYWLNKSGNADINQFLIGEAFVIHIKSTPADRIEGHIDFGGTVGQVMIPPEAFTLVSQSETEYIWASTLWRDNFDEIEKGTYIFNFTGYHPEGTPTVQSNGIYEVEVVGSVFDVMKYYRSN